MPVPNPVTVGPLTIGRGRPLALICGPCVMEPGDMTRFIAGRLVEICESLRIPLIFKASFDKANRTSKSSYRGPGLEEGMRIFERIKAETGLPGTPAVHGGRPLNLKKGQFMAPWDMTNVVAKVCGDSSAGILLTERGTTFGYGRLVNDFQGI